MGGIHIGAADGTVTFPDGTTLRADTTRSAFLATDAGRAAGERDYGTRPWVHHPFTAGAVEGKPLLVSACFYDELLVNVTITADLQPEKPMPRDWSDYSLDVEAETKRFHDRLLEAMLGPATRRTKLGVSGFTAAQATLAEPREWGFVWGKVTSAHDLKGGGTSIVVNYGDRLAECHRAYRAR